MTSVSIVDMLPPAHAEIVAGLAAAFAAGGAELFLVGGIVRDVLMERPLPADLDFATSASPAQTRDLGTRAGAASVYDIGEEFGTVGFIFAPDDAGGPIQVEITTYRQEHYPDQTRRPAVQLGGTLDDDLARRDFTANAIAVDAASGALVDPYDGQADIALAVLRAVGDPDERFEEDPLRLLRAARFVAQLGFRIDPETAVAMTRQAPSLARISRERILAEMTKLLTGEFASHGLEALRVTGLLAHALPDLAPLAEATSGVHRGGWGREKDLWAHTKRVVDQAPRRPVVRWAALLHDAAKPQTRSIDPSGEVHFFGHELAGAKLAARLLGGLKADKTTQAAVRRLVELHGRPAAYETDWTDSAVRRLALEADDVLDDLLDLAAADVTSAREQKQRAAAARIAALRAHVKRLEAERALAELQSPLDGDELMHLFGRPPGIWIKHVKEHLRDLVIDGALLPDDKTTAERIARDLIEREGL